MRRVIVSPMRLLIGAVILAVLLSLSALPRVENFFLTQAGTRSDATLRIALEGLRGLLERSEVLPALIAERPLLPDLLRAPDNQGLVPFTNEQLRLTALILGLSDVYLIAADGTTIAASNYRSDKSFIGQNFAFRPYFRNALEGRGNTGFHALGTTSGKRGYFYAAPVIDGTEITGVIAVKTTLDQFEASWEGNESEIIVVDRNDVVFLSSREDWRYRTLKPLGDAALEDIARTRQYPIGLLRPLDFRNTPFTENFARVEIGGGARAERYVSSVGLIAAAGWRAFVLTPTGPATTQARGAVAIVILAILLVGLVGAVILQRRARLVERLAAQRATQDLLEARVRARTAELDTANTLLRDEVAERTATAQKLRKAQAELVQAGKLAALGQMSAALSHEFNQPLAAVKSYAENAVAYLDRNRTGEALQNIGHISTLADRMAAISKHLRNFARRPQERIGPVPLTPVIDDALQLMNARIGQAGARVTVQGRDDGLLVMGGRIRLQQVLVNLLSNALDAMETVATPEITLTVAASDQPGTCLLHVRDTGPGLDVEDADQIFDPFYTTKPPGQGLGLGLSISYNIVRDFGGNLTARSHPGDGAEFTLTLKIATDSDLP